jgi:hypothetical protein
MMSLMLLYHIGRRYVIVVVGNLTTLAIIDTSAMNVLPLMQLTLTEFWRRECVLRLYLN